MKISRSTKIMLTAAVVLIVAVFQYIYSNQVKQTSAGVAANSRYVFAEAGTSVSYDFNSQAYFYSYDAKGFFFCTKDGMKYVTSDGVVMWNSIFSLTSPIMVGECGIVAVSEPNGRNIYVFDQSGLLYDRRYDEPVLSFSINKDGSLAVILKNGNDYNVLVYKKNVKEPIFNWNYQENWSNQENNVFPLAVDISNDNKVIAISYMDIGVTISARLVFMYLDEADSKNYKQEDGMFASKHSEDEVVGIVKFMDNNALITVSDKAISCYDIGENFVVTDKWRLDLTNQIDYIDFNGDKSFAITLGDELLNQEGKPPGTVLFYNTSGANTGQFNTGRKATYLSVNASGAIIGQNRRFYAVNNRGELLWEYNGLQDIKQMIFLDNKDTVLLATANNGNVMKRTRVKEKAQDIREPDIQELENTDE